MESPASLNASSNHQTIRDTAHKTYNTSQPPPYLHLRELGRGGQAIVDAVEITQGYHKGKVMARKLLRIPRLRYHSQRILRSALDEVQLLKQLTHPHVISIAFTYEELNAQGRIICFGIGMSIVADQTLAEYLEEQEHKLEDLQQNESERETLLEHIRGRMGKWYGCLARGLAYIHAQRIRHKDIKPANILIKDENILYTDFGLSKQFQDEITTMTDGTSGLKTPKYCAPEVAAEHPRGRPSDIWSLGCVFLEMTTIFADSSMSEYEALRVSAGSPAYHLHSDLNLRLILSLGERLLLSELQWPADWCLLMLNPLPEKRITAAYLARLTNLEPAMIPFASTCACQLHRSQTTFVDSDVVLTEVMSRIYEDMTPSGTRISWTMLNNLTISDPLSSKFFDHVSQMDSPLTRSRHLWSTEGRAADRTSFNIKSRVLPLPSVHSTSMGAALESTAKNPIHISPSEDRRAGSHRFGVLTSPSPPNAPLMSTRPLPGVAAILASALPGGYSPYSIRHGKHTLPYHEYINQTPNYALQDY